MHLMGSRLAAPETPEVAALLRGVRVAGDVLRDACDFDLGAFTEILEPDSFYQTLMSEHAALILLGLAATPIATATGATKAIP